MFLFLLFLLLVVLLLLLLLLYLSLLLLTPGTSLSSLVEIRSVTAELLLTLSFWVDGGWVVRVQSHFHVKPNFCYVC